MNAFVATVMVMLKPVFPPVGHSTGNLSSSSFLLRAVLVLLASQRGCREMGDVEEAMSDLNEIQATLPVFWAHSTDTLASENCYLRFLCNAFHGWS